jgi:hypothetical protein
MHWISHLGGMAAWPPIASALPNNPAAKRFRHIDANRYAGMLESGLDRRDRVVGHQGRGARHGYGMVPRFLFDQDTAGKHERLDAPRVIWSGNARRTWHCASESRAVACARSDRYPGPISES